jgi:hypothetical protein
VYRPVARFFLFSFSFWFDFLLLLFPLFFWWSFSSTWSIRRNIIGLCPSVKRMSSTASNPTRSITFGWRPNRNAAKGPPPRRSPYEPTNTVSLFCVKPFLSLVLLIFFGQFLYCVQSTGMLRPTFQRCARLSLISPVSPPVSSSPIRLWIFSNWPLNE